VEWSLCEAVVFTSLLGVIVVVCDVQICDGVFRQSDWAETRGWNRGAKPNDQLHVLLPTQDPPSKIHKITAPLR